MIVGVGTDIVAIKRIKMSIADKILTEKEREIAKSFGERRKIEFLAGRFAAKEAIYKAINNPNYQLSQIEVLSDESGRPICLIEGYKIHVSISHETEYAIAYAICEKE